MKKDKTDLRNVNKQLTKQTESWVLKGYVMERKLDEGRNAFRKIANGRKSYKGR